MGKPCETGLKRQAASPPYRFDCITVDDITANGWVIQWVRLPITEVGLGLGHHEIYVVDRDVPDAPKVRVQLLSGGVDLKVPQHRLGDGRCRSQQLWTSSVGIQAEGVFHHSDLGAGPMGPHQLQAIVVYEWDSEPIVEHHIADNCLSKVTDGLRIMKISHKRILKVGRDGNSLRVPDVQIIILAELAILAETDRLLVEMEVDGANHGPWALG